MSWINDLDMCASLGIIDFDAPAYIRGTNPRYVGSPEFASITGEIPNIKPQPQKDEFSKEISHGNPSWKKWAFGIFAAGLAIFGAYKFKNTKFITNIGDKVKLLPDKIKNLPSKIAELGTKGLQLGKKGFEKIKNFFKKTP